ncbi:MAG: serpin family protein [Granulosicoccus sp.]
MRKLTYLRQVGGIVLLAGLLVGCSDSNGGLSDSTFADSDAVNERFGSITSRDLSPDVTDETKSALVESINDFSLEFHRAISNAAPNDGSIESGYSAAVALAFASAATGSNTYSSLVSLLGFDTLDENALHPALNELALQLESRSNGELELRTANRVFVKPNLDLQTRFLDIATNDYGAPVTEADFLGAPQEVADEVNGWVSDQTNGFIPTIVEKFDPDTVFALLNAIFLDAIWQDEFEEKGSQSFISLDGSLTTVPSFGGRAALPQLQRDDLTALEIPYRGGELAMLILMPQALEAFEQSLNNDSLNAVIQDLQITDLEITVPEWQLESDLDLMELLAPLGLPSSPWDFERLVNGGDVLDVFARQKARIEVDKDGTRAAAVTLVAGITSVPQQLIINRPFVYLLRDRTSGVILFSGRVLEP